jgi:hypothetical protein
MQEWKSQEIPPQPIVINEYMKQTGRNCFLMTGTCVVPPNEFTLNENDVVNISIDGVGVLTNTIAKKL